MARILAIEDEPTNLWLVTYLLTQAGHDVEGCRDGRAALAAVRVRPPDLVVCDIELPQLTGYEFARELRADPAFRALPLLAVTALAMRGDREQVLAAGFTDYIAKPIDPQTFVAQVEAYLPK